MNMKNMLDECHDALMIECACDDSWCYCMYCLLPWI